MTASGLGERLEESLRAAGVEPVVYDHIVGEPSEASVREAVEAARGGFDGFVGVGGGSALDTAKLCALFATHDGELLDYVNAPIGARRAPCPGPLLPLVALPTTVGHRLRGDDGRDRRLPAARHEDRHLAPAPAAVRSRSSIPR